ncbi:MAG: DinB family protein [Thermoplasmata archaeon]|nr:DinB family protein [Thermoplasmata archaeon]MCI4341267.1 DinB family protein [Thermoplasmata archaeon]
MSGLASIRALLAYDRSVLGRFERSLRRRGWKEATRNHEIGHRSLKNTLVHILNVREAWLVAIDQGKWEVFDAPGRRPEAIESWAALATYRDYVWAAVDPWVARLTDRELHHRIKAPWMPGKYTVADSFLQASYEQAHHLGEIIAVFWQQDWPPPPMTWIENSTGRPRG